MSKIYIHERQKQSYGFNDRKNSVNKAKRATKTHYEAIKGAMISLDDCKKRLQQLSHLLTFLSVI
jgi:hypothetical protein